MHGIHITRYNPKKDCYNFENDIRRIRTNIIKRDKLTIFTLIAKAFNIKAFIHTEYYIHSKATLSLTSWP